MNRKRILYSFPHRLGAGQICYTAWQHVTHIAPLLDKLVVSCGSIERQVPSQAQVVTTLTMGKLRLPYRLLGRNRACWLHDYLTARYLQNHAQEIDLFHGWPLGSKRSLRTARALGIKTVVERPNAHTKFAFEVVDAECKRIGFQLPKKHEHRPNAHTLRTEEAEYALADAILCPSLFVRSTFLRYGFPESKLINHQYGYDPERFYPRKTADSDNNTPVLVFAGYAAPRKGLHIALNAWKASSLSKKGRFLICGPFIEGYAEHLGDLLTQPNVEILGHRKDLHEILGKADALVLPTFEEGSALVTYEARGSGCVLMVSESSGAICTDNVDALVHRAGDVDTLRAHFDLLATNPNKFKELRAASLSGIGKLTWQHAGVRLAQAYEQVLTSKPQQTPCT